MTDDGLQFSDRLLNVGNIIKIYTLLPANRLFPPVNDLIIILAAIGYASSAIAGIAA
jgi:hypothetical protein